MQQPVEEKIQRLLYWMDISLYLWSHVIPVSYTHLGGYPGMAPQQPVQGGYPGMAPQQPTQGGYPGMPGGDENNQQ